MSEVPKTPGTPEEVGEETPSSIEETAAEVEATPPVDEKIDEKPVEPKPKVEKIFPKAKKRDKPEEPKAATPIPVPIPPKPADAEKAPEPKETPLTPEQVAQKAKEEEEKKAEAAKLKEEEEKRNRPLPTPSQFDQAAYEQECLDSQTADINQIKLRKAKLKLELIARDQSLSDSERQVKLDEISAEIEAMAADRIESRVSPEHMQNEKAEEILKSRIIALDNLLAQRYLEKAQRGEQLTAEEMKAVLHNFVENGRNSALQGVYLKGMNFNNWKDALDHFGIKEAGIGKPGLQEIDALGNKIPQPVANEAKNQEEQGLVARIRDAMPSWLRRGVGESARSGAIMASTAGIVALITGGAIAWPALLGGAAAATATGLVGRWMQNRALTGKKGDGKSLGEAAMTNIEQYILASQQNARAVLENQNLKQEELSQQFNLIVKQLKDKSIIEYGKKGAAPDQDPIQKFEQTRQRFDKGIGLARIIAQLGGGAIGSGFFAAQQLAIAKAQGIDMANNQMVHSLTPHIQNLAQNKMAVAGHHIMFNQADHAWHAVLTQQDVTAAQHNLGGNFTQKMLDHYWTMSNPDGTTSAIAKGLIPDIGGASQVLHSSAVVDPTWQVIREAFGTGMQNTAIATGLEGLWSMVNAIKDRSGNDAAKAAFANLYQNNLPPADPLAASESGFKGPESPDGSGGGGSEDPKPDKPRFQNLADQNDIDKRFQSGWADEPPKSEKRVEENSRLRKNIEKDLEWFERSLVEKGPQDAFKAVRGLIEKPWKDPKGNNAILFCTEDNITHLADALATGEGQKRLIVSVDAAKLEGPSAYEELRKKYNLYDDIEVVFVPKRALQRKRPKGKKEFVETNESILWGMKIVPDLVTLHNMDSEHSIHYQVVQDPRNEKAAEKKDVEVVRTENIDRTKLDPEEKGKAKKVKVKPLSKREEGAEERRSKLRLLLTPNLLDIIQSGFNVQDYSTEGEVEAKLQGENWKQYILTEEEKNNATEPSLAKQKSRLKILLQISKNMGLYSEDTALTESQRSSQRRTALLETSTQLTRILNRLNGVEEVELEENDAEPRSFIESFMQEQAAVSHLALRTAVRLELIINGQDWLLELNSLPQLSTLSEQDREILTTETEKFKDALGQLGDQGPALEAIQFALQRCVDLTDAIGHFPSEVRDAALNSQFISDLLEVSTAFYLLTPTEQQEVDEDKEPSPADIVVSADQNVEVVTAESVPDMPAAPEDKTETPLSSEKNLNLNSEKVRTYLKGRYKQHGIKAAQREALSADVINLSEVQKVVFSATELKAKNPTLAETIERVKIAAKVVDDPETDASARDTKQILEGLPARLEGLSLAQQAVEAADLHGS